MDNINLKNMTLYEEILEIKKRRENPKHKQGLQGLQGLQDDLITCNDCNNSATLNVTVGLQGGCKTDQGHQPEAIFDPGDQVEPLTGEIETNIAELERLIIEALQGRPLPIQVSPCEQILEVAGYARGEARNAYHQSRYVRGPARVRLAMLGIDI